MEIQFRPETPARSFSLQLNTFRNPREGEETFVDWAREARKLAEEPFLPWTRDRPFGFDKPFGYWIGLGGQDLRNETITLDWNEQNWDLLLGELKQGRLRNFRLLGRLQDGFRLPQDELGGILVEIDFAGLEYEDAATALVLSVGRPLFGTDLDHSTRMKWVELAQKARDIDAVTGFLTVDHAGPYESPYEMSIDRYWLDGRRECRNWLRGYYWGNLLGPGHIERLGGFERIKNEAPGEVVADLSDGRGELVYLQLSPNPDAVSDDDLSALKKFLAPVLPEPKPSAQPYEGPPLRVV